jgi:hypothetical protein
MRKYLFLFLLLFLLPFTAAAEGYIGGGLDLRITPKQEPALTPELFLDGGGDFFFPAGRRWSFFLNTGGQFSFYPLEEDVSGNGSLTGDVSYRGERFFGKLQLGTYLEHATWRSSPYWYQHAELYLSYDFEKVSLYIAPQFIWEIEDTDHTTGVEGRAGCSLDLGRFVLSPEFNGGIHFLPDKEHEILYGPNIEFSWYPGLPFTISGSVGFRRIDSTVTEVLVEDGDRVQIDDSSSVYLEPKGSFFLSKMLTMEIQAPLTWTLKDHGYVEDEEIQSTREYTWYIAPELVFNIDTSGPLSFRLSGGMEILRSNSSSLNSGSGNVTLSTDISF